MTPTEYKLWCNSLTKPRLAFMLNAFYRKDRPMSLSAANVLNNSFTWEDTRQGYSYWDTIYNNLLSFDTSQVKLLLASLLL